MGCHSLFQGIFLPRDQTQVSHIAGGFPTAEPQGKAKNTGVGSPSLLQWIFQTQELKRGLLHCRWILYQLSYGARSLAQLCLTLGTPWTVAHQAPLSMGFPRQEYWSGLPFPSPGDLPDPGIEPECPAWQEDCLPLSHLDK